MKNILEYLDRAAVSSLPEGDVDMLHSTLFKVVPRVGHSCERSWFHRDLETSNFKGKVLTLPDVGRFKIELNAFDPALLANGICSRYPSKITLYQNRNRRLNRYLTYVFWRLNKLQGNQHAYWCFTQTLIRRSSAYLIACLHSVDKNIYRYKSMKELRMLLLRLNNMRGAFVTRRTQFGRQRLTTNHGNEILTVSLMQHYLKFFRVYIPKGNDHRPLGVPTLAWRIFQKMWLPPLLIFTQEEIPDNFHGYLPRRGCGTAWQEILKTVIRTDNIYEVDFRQFFPSVDSDFLLNFMVNKWKISLPVAIYLYQLNQSLPIFLESKSHDKIHGEIRFTPAHQVSLVENQAKLFANRLKERTRAIKGLSLAGLEDLDEYATEDSLLRDYSTPGSPTTVNENIFASGNNLSYAVGNTRAWMEAQRVTPRDPNKKLRRELGFEFKGNVGLPQGGSLSPNLSILYLAEVFNHLRMPEDVKYIFYADDGIFYSESYSSLANWLSQVTLPGGLPNTFEYFNIRVHPDKSAWVKKAGQWLKTLKFLGLVFIPGKSLADSRLVAATRNGSKLEFNQALRDLVHLEYAQSLVFDPKLKVIFRRLEALKQLPDNNITRTMTAYYNNLKELASWELSPAQFEYGYFLQSIFARPIDYFVTAYTGMFKLINTGSLVETLDFLKDSDSETLREIKLGISESDFLEISQEEMPWLDKILYSPKELSVHQTVSSEMARNSTRLPYAVNEIFSEPTPEISFLRDVGEWFGESLTAMMSPTNLRLSLTGKDITPHPYIFWNTLLQPFQTLTGKWHRLLGGDISRSTLRYFRNKYQFDNLVRSRYFGLILARMYSGSLNMPVVQDFDMTYVRESLAEYMHDKSPVMRTDDSFNIFTGSSYACREMVRMTTYLKAQSANKKRRRFILFDKGLLPLSTWGPVS